jgi:hypothetical protein
VDRHTEILIQEFLVEESDGLLHGGLTRTLAD